MGLCMSVRNYQENYMEWIELLMEGDMNQFKQKIKHDRYIHINSRHPYWEQTPLCWFL